MMNPLYFAPMRKYVWILMSFIFFTLGCPGGTTTQVDIPLLSELEFNYNQGLNQLFFSVRVDPSYLGKKVQAVNVLYFGFDSTQTADTLVLNDGGNNGDVIGNDDVYSIKVTNDTNHVSYVLQPTDTGNVFVKFLAQYGTEIKGKSVDYPMGNQGPVILSVSMPDTMHIPDGNTVSVGTIVVTIDDPNSHEDVQTCYLMFQKPDGTYSSGSPITLYDDGNQDFSMYLWDENENDGKFSRYIIIDANNPLGKYHAYFYARDYSGILSEPYVTTLAVIP